MRYVIIGNSTAAVGCIEGIRQRDREGSITVIADEKHHTYSRPLISYLLCGKTDRQRMKYRGDGFYEENGCTAMLGKRASGIDAEKKTVKLSEGGDVPYDRLLIATGSRPFIPHIEGYEAARGKTTFMSLDDTEKLERMIDKDSRVLIIGAGLIGLKCAEGLYGRVKSITVVDLADRVLPSILDSEGSRIVRERLESKGIKLLLGESADNVKDGVATLKSGVGLGFDVMVMAAGVRPNTEIFEGEKRKGIVTNNRCETSVPDVYAAGDCTESFDITTGGNRIMALLPNAYMQGECAGINMAGGDALYGKGLPMNAIGIMGLHIMTAGSYEGESHIAKKDGNYKRLVTKDGLLKGYILIGDVERAGIYTSLIRERKPLDSIDFELIKEKPQLMAFSKKDRNVKLGGVV